MPELAEVEWYRKQWNPGLGHEILDIRLHSKKRIFRGTNTRSLRQALVGRRFLRSCTRGKQILFQFSGDNFLGVHLGMTGKVRTDAANLHPAKHDHLVLYQRQRSLVFTDSRQFGRVRFHSGKAPPDWWKADIPEIATAEFNLQFVEAFLRRHSKATIKAVLLMQSGFPGIGNWMADEILWRARIHPARRSGRLTASQRNALFRETKLVVAESLRTLGKDFSDPPRSWLIHQRWKKTGKCPKHGTLLRRATIGGRTTAWCPKCQRQGRPVRT